MKQTKTKYLITREKSKKKKINLQPTTIEVRIFVLAYYHKNRKTNFLKQHNVRKGFRKHIF